MLKKFINFVGPISLLLCVFFWIQPAISEEEGEDPISSLFHEATGIPEASRSKQAPWIAHTLVQFSDAVRMRTSELVLYVEQAAALPGHLKVMLDKSHTDDDLMKETGIIFFEIIFTFALAILGEMLFSFIQTKVFLEFKEIHPRWKNISSILLNPLVFFGVGFVSLSLFVSLEPLRTFFIGIFFGIFVLKMCLRILNFLQTFPRYEKPLTEVSSSLKGLFYWVFACVVIDSFFYLIKAPKLLSGISFGIIGFVIFSLFTNCILKLRPFFDAWFKKKDYEHRCHLTSPFFRFLSHRWHFLLIISAFLIYLTWAFRDDSQAFFIKFLSSVFIVVLGQLFIGLWHYLLKLWTDTDSLLSRVNQNISTHISKTLRFISWFFYMFAYILVFVLIGKIWGTDLIGWIDDTFKLKSLNILVDISITLILGIFIWQVVEAAIEEYLTTAAKKVKGSRQEKLAQIQRLQTILPVFQNALRWILGTILALMVLAQSGVDITPLLTGLGIFGLALSFGAQSLVKDFINGINILLDGSLNIGDRVTLGTHKGIVENLNLRNVELRDYETGAVHIIPFSQVEEISNFSRDFNYCTFEIGIPQGQDIGLLCETIQEVLKEMQEDPKTKDFVLGQADIWGIKEMDGLKLSVDGRFKTGVFTGVLVKSEFNHRLQLACKAKNIQLSSPGEVVYLYSDKPSDKP